MAGEREEHVVERRPVQRDVLDRDPGVVEAAHRLEQDGRTLAPDRDPDQSGIRGRPSARRRRAPAASRPHETGARRRRGARAPRRRSCPSAPPTSLRRSRSRGRSPRCDRRGWSASSRYCVQSRSVVPSFWRSRISSHSTRRLRGSRPVVGSSMKSTLGCPTRLAPTSSRRRMPPEYVLAVRCAASARSKRSSTSCARLRASAAEQVVQPSDHLEVLEAGEVLVDGCELAGEADHGPQQLGVADDVEPAPRSPTPRRARAAW